MVLCLWTFFASFVVANLYLPRRNPRRCALSLCSKVCVRVWNVHESPTGAKRYQLVSLLHVFRAANWHDPVPYPSYKYLRPASPGFWWYPTIYYEKLSFWTSSIFKYARSQRCPIELSAWSNLTSKKKGILDLWIVRETCMCIKFYGIERQSSVLQKQNRATCNLLKSLR